MATHDVKMSGVAHMRPAKPGDRAFLERLHDTARNDLRLADAEEDYIQSVIDMQYQAQTTGYGAQFPNAQDYIVEDAQTSIGRVRIAFTEREVILVDIAFIPAAQGKGYGKQVLMGIQQTATKVMAPVFLTVHRTNIAAIHLYLSLGFKAYEDNPLLIKMVWYPVTGMQAEGL